MTQRDNFISHSVVLSGNHVCHSIACIFAWFGFYSVMLEFAPKYSSLIECTACIHRYRKWLLQQINHYFHYLCLAWRFLKLLLAKYHTYSTSYLKLASSNMLNWLSAMSFYSSSFRAFDCTWHMWLTLMHQPGFWLVFLSCCVRLGHPNRAGPAQVQLQTASTGSDAG